MRSWIYILASTLLLVSCEREDGVSPEVTPLFHEVSSNESGIRFSNDLTVDLETPFNLLDFDYFYNGAGVGVIDINNDGLDDLLFTGNMTDNKLFLNKGNLRFEDISDSAGINTAKYWSNGVSVADVNQDGWLDLYISQGGPHKEADRGNLLFINNRDLTFSERAAEFGLDDKGISTQSAFFDYDKDGDLDCIVMNESVLYGYDPVSFLRRLASNEQDSRMSLSRLYRNDGDSFTDVGIEAGISKPSFGLGLVVADINHDSHLDIYIANDYYLPDAMYINQGDGTFKDEIKQRTSQISMFGMGVDIDDIDQDGFNDILVLDMAADDHIRSKTLMASMDTKQFDLLVNQLRFQYQYMFNSLLVNNGDHSFKNLAQLTGLAKSDWSWAALIQDYDLDGNKDVFITNGYRKYGLDNDFKLRVNEAKSTHNNRVPLAIKTELYASIPEGKLPNLMYRNVGQLTLEDVSEKWGFGKASFSNGAAHADLDNDGDLDIVINNIDQPAMLYENHASDQGKNFVKIRLKDNDKETFGNVTLSLKNGQQLTGEAKRIRGYRSSLSPDLIFGIVNTGSIESIEVKWLDGSVQIIDELKINELNIINKNSRKLSSAKKENTLFSTVQNSAIGLNYFHQENDFDDFQNEILLPVRQSTLGPKLTSFDANGDGKEDVLIGGASGYATSLFIQQNNTFKKKDIPAFGADLLFEDMASTSIDIDADGDEDLFVASGGNAFESGRGRYINRLYINDGSGNFNRSRQPELESSDVHSAKAISIDINSDGTPELFVANRIKPQQYPIHAPALIYEWRDNFLVDNTTAFCDGCDVFGMMNDALAADIDGDGDQDLLAVGEWTGIGVFRNNGNKLVLEEDLLDQTGWWYSITETDANNDGRPDFIIGNLGLNSKYKASNEKPFKIYATDFDENGSHDIVLSNKYKDEYVPLRGKECSSQQMPFIKEKYPTYEGFANASLVDIYGSKIEDAYEKEVISFKSILLLNTPDGFELNTLPRQAQEFPIIAGVTLDINRDGNEDVVLAGNMYQTEVETPRLDSGFGLALIADGKGSYSALKMKDSGLKIPGDVKSLATLNMAGGETFIIAGKNQGLLQIIKFNED